jgi:hypothetical protein
MRGWRSRGFGVAVLVGWGLIFAPAPVVLSGEEPAAPEQPAQQATVQQPTEQPAAEPSAEPKENQPQEQSKQAVPEAVKPPAKPALDPQQIALRNRVRRVLAWYAKLPINTADNTPGEVLQFCLACGADAEIHSGGASGKPVSAFGALCYNFPCAGYELLSSTKDGVMARIGYGLQAYPAEMLGVLALTGVPADYGIRVGDKEHRVADLVEYEKLTCQSGTNLSLKLIALAFYVPGDASWKNQLGESWSAERLFSEEWKRPPATTNSDVTNHLTALTWALQRRIREGRPVDGPYREAEPYLAKFEEAAFQAQNRDGSWRPDFFAARAPGRDQEASLFATGHVLGWLAYRLPEDRLDDPRMVRAVTFATTVLEQWSSRWDVTETSPREITAAMHALHALRTYDRRFFKARE